MSCNYADGLSPYDNKGKLGLKEKFDNEDEVNAKVLQLSMWMKEAHHVVVHTGAGISTAAGIPDFRGPNGVWTLEAKGLKPKKNIAFDEAKPTKTHMALVKLVECGLVQYIISQNIDGLHLRSGLSRKSLAELHGNMYIEQCNHCGRQFVRGSSTTSVGQKCLDKPCPAARANGQPCRGRLHDTILDWEHNLPESDLQMSDYHSSVADLSICLGTTLQIIPSGNLPLATKKSNGRLVICNLQPTKHDRKADLIINSYVDEIMVKLMKFLEVPFSCYNPALDPSAQIRTCKSEKSCLEWTLDDNLVMKMKALYECKRKEFVKKKVKRKQDSEVTVAKQCKTEQKHIDIKAAFERNESESETRTKDSNSSLVQETKITLRTNLNNVDILPNSPQHIDVVFNIKQEIDKTSVVKPSSMKHKNNFDTVATGVNICEPPQQLQDCQDKSIIKAESDDRQLALSNSSTVDLFMDNDMTNNEECTQKPIYPS